MYIFYCGNIGRFRYWCGFGHHLPWRASKMYKVASSAPSRSKVFDWLHLELTSPGHYLLCTYHLNENIFFIRGLEQFLRL